MFVITDLISDSGKTGYAGYLNTKICVLDTTDLVEEWYIVREFKKIANKIKVLGYDTRTGCIDYYKKDSLYFYYQDSLGKFHVLKKSSNCKFVHEREIDKESLLSLLSCKLFTFYELDFKKYKETLSSWLSKVSTFKYEYCIDSYEHDKFNMVKEKLLEGSSSLCVKKFIFHFKIGLSPECDSEVFTKFQVIDKCIAICIDSNSTTRRKTITCNNLRTSFKKFKGDYYKALEKALGEFSTFSRSLSTLIPFESIDFVNNMNIDVSYLEHFIVSSR